MPAPSKKLVVRALYDYKAAVTGGGGGGGGSKVSNTGGAGGLSFRKGDVIRVINQLDSGWWDGVCNGERGWFPSNYVASAVQPPPPPPATAAAAAAATSAWTSNKSTRGDGDDNNENTEDALMLASVARTDAELPPLPLTNIPRPIQINSNPSSMHYNAITSTTNNNAKGCTSNIASLMSPGSITPGSNTGSLLTPTTANANNSFESRFKDLSIGNIGGGGGGVNGVNTTTAAAANATISNASESDDGWRQKKTPDGRVYFYNVLTDETSWTLDHHGQDNPCSSPISSSPARSPAANVFASSPQSSSLISITPPEASSSSASSSSVSSEWTFFESQITTQINLLKQMVGHKQKDRYIIQASAIVEAIRIMLYASDTARKDSQIILSSRVVKMNQRLIINALSKLVLASKLASCVWPPPDAAENMNSALAEVLQAIRQFIVAAQDAGVVISLHNLEMMQHVNNPVTNSSVIATPTTATSEYSEASTLNGEVVESSPSNYYSKNYIPMASSSSSLSPPSSSPSPPLPPSSHFSTHQLIAELDRLTQSLVKMIDVLIKGIRLNQANASSLIAEVRAIVSQVGNVLSLVDEVSIDAVLEELAVDFKVNRLTLYNNVSGLVMATQAATSPLSPSNAIEQVIQSSGLISKSVKDLLVSTKCLIEEKENLEQSNLLDYINNFKSSSDLSGKPRRAFSLNEAMRPTALYHELNSNTTAPFSADSTFNAINATAPSTEVATIVHQMDPSLTNAPHTDTAEHQQQQQQQPLHATSPQSTAHYLQYDYRPEEIVNSMDGKVRGGTLNALIERLTLHDILDSNFVCTFLLTYRSFTTTADLFAHLKARFLIEPPSSLEDGELAEWIEKKQTPIRLRVFNVMKSWVENYFHDSAEDFEIMGAMKGFAQTVMSASSMELASLQLVRSIEKRLTGLPRKLLITANRDCPLPIIPKNLKKIRFLDLDPLEVARQLTIMEARDFNKIQPNEFLSKAWSVKNGNSVAENVQAMVRMSNNVTSWVAESILLCKDVKIRAAYMKHFILIAEKCRQLNNFNTLMSILAGLNSAPVHRLKRTFELLSSRTQGILEGLKGLMSTSRNFSVYREIIHSANPPVIPFLGFYLTDLTFLEDGNPDYIVVGAAKSSGDIDNPTESASEIHPPSSSSTPSLAVAHFSNSRSSISSDNLQIINFAKRAKTAEVIREIQQFQNSPYLLTPVLELQDFLRQCFLEVPEENDLYDLSLHLEPREREDEKIARLLTESGFL